MIEFAEGDRVEYAAHPVSWQAGRNETEIPWHQADGRSPLAAVDEADEEWRPATVLAVMKHPIAPHLNRHEADVVLTLADDEGHPPFDLNALLARSV